MTTVRVPVRAEVLRWACQRRGLTADELAERFPRLHAWLDGTTTPTLKQLEAFAHATYTPVGFLFLSHPPTEAVPIPDLRTVGNAPLPRPSPNMLETLHECQQRQNWYREYAQLSGAKAHEFVGSIPLSANAAVAAGTIRAALGWTLREQRQSPSWEAALARFIQRADDLGVLVMCNGIVGVNTHRRLEPDEFRGFALADPFAPLVFVNTADSKAAQMFTLAHELAHLWCGASALSDVSPAQTRVQNPTERWCNAVAAELLVPIDALRLELRAHAAPMDECRRLSGLFKVSTLVMLRRLFDADHLGRDEFSSLYAAELARLRARIAEGGGGNFYLTQRSRIGRRFVRAVLESTWEGRSSFTDAFRMLGARSVESLTRLGAAVEWQP